MLGCPLATQPGIDALYKHAAETGLCLDIQLLPLVGATSGSEPPPPMSPASSLGTVGSGPLARVGRDASPAFGVGGAMGRWGIGAGGSPGVGLLVERTNQLSIQDGGRAAAGAKVREAAACSHLYQHSPLVVSCMLRDQCRPPGTR